MAKWHLEPVLQWENRFEVSLPCILQLIELSRLTETEVVNCFHFWRIEWIVILEVSSTFIHIKRRDCPYYQLINFSNFSDTSFLVIWWQQIWSYQTYKSSKFQSNYDIIKHMTSIKRIAITVMAGKNNFPDRDKLEFLLPRGRSPRGSIFETYQSK